MVMVQGHFVGFTAAELAEMKADWIAALHAVARGQQSYSLAGRSFTRADLKEIRETLGEINHALNILGANGVARPPNLTYADMSNGP